MKARNLKNTGGEWNAEVKKQMLEWSHDEVSTLVKSLVPTIPGLDYQILHLQHTTIHPPTTFESQPWETAQCTPHTWYSNEFFLPSIKLCP
jgi:hypothetical protein